MPIFPPDKKLVQKNSTLQSKIKNSDPVIKSIIAEYRKEISRLQKLLAKTEVKNQSEIERLRAELAEERKNKIKFVISKNEENL